jgi:hypothetical protein
VVVHGDAAAGDLDKLDKSLIGRQVAVNIVRLGWCVGKITKFYAHRKNGINYEIRFIIRDAGLRDAYLASDAYGDVDDRVGSWVFLRPPNAGSVNRPLNPSVSRTARKRSHRPSGNDSGKNMHSHHD